MTRNKDTPGPLVGDFKKREQTNKAYYNTERKQGFEKLFYTFKNKMVLESLETYAQDKRVMMFNVTGVNTADDGIRTLAYDAWREGHVSGHMKDVTSAEEEAYYDLCEDAWAFITELRNEWAAVTLLDNPPYDDETTTTTSAHKFLKPETFETLLENMNQRNIIIPTWIVELAKILTGIRSDVSPSYSIYGTNIPPCTLVFGCRKYDLEELQTVRDSLNSHIGLALQHMNKFGISYQKWSDDFVKSTREIPFPSAEFYALMQMINIGMADSGNNAKYWSLNNIVDFDATSDWSALYFLLYKGEVPDIFLFTPCFYPHHATNNKYGGLFQYLGPNSSEGDMNILSYAQNGTAVRVVDCVNNITDAWVLGLFPFMGADEFAGAATFDMCLTGGLTAELLLFDGPTAVRHPFLELFRSTGSVSQSTMQSFLLRKIINLTKFK